MSATPCRADHIGSLLRPCSLKDAYKAHAAGRLDLAAFDAAVDQAVREALWMQEAAGLNAVTDGEFRRRSWFAGFVDAVDGLTHRDTEFNFMEAGEAALSVPVPHAEAPIRRTRGIATGEFGFLKGVAKRIAKITLPAPSVIHFFRGPDGIDNQVYPDEDQFWHDLVAVYRAEIAELGSMGLSYLQLDDVPPALLCDAKIQQLGRVTVGGTSPVVEAERRGAAAVVYLSSDEPQRGRGGRGGQGTVRRELDPPVLSAYSAPRITALQLGEAATRALLKGSTLDAASLDPAVVEREKNVLADKFKQQGKPANVIDKIVESGLKTFYKEVCLLDQAYIRDDKKSVSQVLKEAEGKAGGPIKVAGFVRYALGEGIEKQETDFAAEVAAAAGQA